MPWDVNDVDRFKSGLTQAQKRRWVRIANSALRRCQNNGGSNCEASAIRQANGSVNNNSMEFINIQINNDHKIREETHQGKKHIVVPVTMMVEGVHSGSDGPLFHPADELGKFPAAWNGMPVVINHPNYEGSPISANNPDVIDSEKVGVVYNSHMEDHKLKSEIWFDEQKLLSVSPSTLNRIKEGDVIEVSLGVFNDQEPTQGTYNNEQYVAIARNHRPDHLAVLPEDRGACSTDDGCGINMNKNKGGKMDENKIINALKKFFKKEGIDPDDESSENSKTHDPEMNVNQEGDLRDLIHNLSHKVDRMDMGNRVHFLESVFEDHIIIKVHNQNDGSEEFIRQEYTVNEDNTIEFTGNPQKVQKEVNFVEVSNNVQTKKGGNKMPNNKNEVQTNCSDKIGKLIANKATKFTEDDREFLGTLNEEQLDKLFPVEPEGNSGQNNNSQNQVTQNNEGKANENVEKEVTEEDIKKVFSQYADKPEEFAKAFLPKEAAEQISDGIATNRQRRQELVKGITNNSDFTEEDLQTWSTGGLQKLYNSVIPQGNYIGQGGNGYQPSNNEEDELPEPMLPPGVETKDENNK